MLSTSLLSVTYSFTDLNDYQSSRLRIILIEKQTNGKLEVQHYALPDDFSGDNIQRMPSFGDQTPDWVYVNCNTFHSEIVIFDGKVCSNLELGNSKSVRLSLLFSLVD